MTIALVDGSFTGVGNSNPVCLKDGFNLSIDGTFNATVVLQRSFDSGSTWHLVERFTAPVQLTGHEPEAYISYRLVCTGHTSGTIQYRLSQ